MSIIKAKGKNRYKRTVFILVFHCFILAAIFSGCSSNSNEKHEGNSNFLSDTTKTKVPGTPNPISNNSVKPKMVYLTFDDGPSRNTTPKNLDTLRKYNVKATFFVLPNKEMDDIYRRIIEEGHVVGNHSFSHNYRVLYSSPPLFKKDLIQARDFMKNRFNYTTTVYRFPGGTTGKNKSMIHARTQILKDEGYSYFNWDVSSGDTDPGPLGKRADVLANNILNNVKGRDSAIVLMHDSSDKTTTVAALPLIIKGLKNQGFSFGVLSRDLNKMDL